MAFTDEIQIAINTLFDNSGVKNARNGMSKLRNISDNTGLGISELQNRMQGLGLEFNKQGQFIDSQTGQFVSQSQAIQELKSGYAAMAGAANRSGRSVKGIANSLDESQLQLKRNAEGAMMFQNRYTGAMRNGKQATGELRRATNQFRMEQLSLMFGFMALRRVMTGMLRPAFKSAGVFDTISSILEIVFLPIAIEVQKIMLGFLDFFAGLPRPVKLAIGALVLLVAAIATVGLIMTQISLVTSAIWGPTMGQIAVSSAESAAAAVFNFSRMSGKTGTILKSLSSTVGGVMSAIAGFISLPILAAIALVVGAVLLLNEAWANNLFGIKQAFADFVIAVADMAPMIGKILENTILAPLNLVIKAINMLTGKDIDTVGEMFESAAGGVKKWAQEMKKNAQAPGEKGQGFLGFSLTGKGGLLEGGIGSIPDKIGGALGGMFMPDVKTPNNKDFGKNQQPNVVQNVFRQDVSVQRGAGNESDFAFSRMTGRELQKANELALSKQQGGR